MILLEDQSQPLPSPLRRRIGPWFRRIVKNIGCARKLRRGSPTGCPAMDRAPCVYLQHFNMHTHLKSVTVAVPKKTQHYFNNPCLGIQKCKYHNQVYWCFHCCWSTAILRCLKIFPLTMNRTVPYRDLKTEVRTEPWLLCTVTPLYNYYPVVPNFI